jgi:ATP/maltotriose-dependent transcriptional regulator MalT
VARTLAVRSQHSAVLGALAEAAYQQGALDDADRYAREAVAALPAEPMLWTGHAEGTIARVQLATGDPQGCIDTLLRAGGGPDLPAYQPGMRAPWYDVIAQAELALGRVDEAAAWAERSAAVAPVFGADIALLLTRARILVAAGEPDAAVDAARRVVTYHRGTGMRIVEGDARRVLAAALAATGDRRAAQEELRRAKELFAACGARAMHAAVVADQRRTGAVKPRARTAGGEQLTERESEVAGLVAAGYSNARVAAQLGLSPKTVQAHLSRVYAKLGVSSRAGLAARIGADQAR